MKDKKYLLTNVPFSGIICFVADTVTAQQILHEWLSGGVSPCQGEGRGFESRLVLLKDSEFIWILFLLSVFLYLLV